MTSDADVLLARLRSVPGLDVHDGHVTDSDPDAHVVAASLPYVVFYSISRVPTGHSLAGTTTMRLVEFQVSFVGETRAQAELVSVDTREVLDQQFVTFSDCQAWVRLTDDSLDARRDDTWTRPGGAPLFFGADRYVVAI